MIGGLIALFLFCSLAIVPEFAKIYRDFECDLPQATVACIWMSTTGARMAMVLVSVLVLGLAPLLLLRKTVWLERMFYELPVLGPMWRWQGLVEFANLMEILLAHQVPLPEALRLTADGVRGADLAAACRKSAARIEAGETLSHCVSELRAFPPTLKPFVDSAAESSRPAAAFEAAAEMFRRRISLDMTLWEVVVPPAILAAIGCSIGFMVIALFMPLISLIQNLT
jgi:type II secretory pathway component PulF